MHRNSLLPLHILQYIVKRYCQRHQSFGFLSHAPSHFDKSYSWVTHPYLHLLHTHFLHLSSARVPHTAQAGFCHTLSVFSVSEQTASVLEDDYPWVSTSSPGPLRLPKQSPTGSWQPNPCSGQKPVLLKSRAVILLFILPALLGNLNLTTSEWSSGFTSLITSSLFVRGTTSFLVNSSIICVMESSHTRSRRLLSCFYSVFPADIMMVETPQVLGSAIMRLPTVFQNWFHALPIFSQVCSRHPPQHRLAAEVTVFSTPRVSILHLLRHRLLQSSSLCRFSAKNLFICLSFLILQPAHLLPAARSPATQHLDPEHTSHFWGPSAPCPSLREKHQALPTARDMEDYSPSPSMYFKC